MGPGVAESEFKNRSQERLFGRLEVEVPREESGAGVRGEEIPNLLQLGRANLRERARLEVGVEHREGTELGAHDALVDPAIRPAPPGPEDAPVPSPDRKATQDHQPRVHSKGPPVGQFRKRMRESSSQGPSSGAVKRLLDADDVGAALLDRLEDSQESRATAGKPGSIQPIRDDPGPLIQIPGQDAQHGHYHTQHMGIRNSSGGRIALTLEGSGEPLVFLCHGLGGNRMGNTARSVVPSLLAAGISVCRFDFTGHGESDGVPGDITLSRGLDDLSRVFAAVKPERYGVFGSSFGGAIALLFCARHPETLALFLKSPVTDLRGLCDAQLGSEGIRGWERDGAIDFPNESGSMRMPWEFYLDAKRWDIGREVDAIRAPMETVHGDVDRTVPLEHSRRLPGTLHVLSGVGHRYLEPGALDRVALLATEFFRTHLG